MKLITQRILRAYLRQQLGTWPEGVPLDNWLLPEVIEPAEKIKVRLESLLSRVRDIGELFVGMANGPFLLVLRASDPQQFIAYADQHPTHNVHIKLEAPDIPNTNQTHVDILANTNMNIQAIVRAVDQPQAYSLSFGLPRILREHILFDESRGIRLKFGLKRKFFSEITIYRRVDDRDLLYRLTYEPQRGNALPDTTAGEVS